MHIVWGSISSGAGVLVQRYLRLFLPDLWES